MFGCIEGLCNHQEPRLEELIHHLLFRNPFRVGMMGIPSETCGSHENCYSKGWI